MATRVGTTLHDEGGIRVSTNEFFAFGGDITFSVDAVDSTHDSVQIILLPPTGYEIQWRDFNTQALVGEAAGFTQTFYVIEGLNPNTTYQWRVKVLASQDWSQWVTFTTNDAIDASFTVTLADYVFEPPTGSAVGELNYDEIFMDLDATEQNQDRVSIVGELLMIPKWPETLPQKLLIDGYNQAAANTVIRSQMDTGPAKQRRRFSAGVIPLGGRLILDETEMDTLRMFYDDTLLGGSLRFRWYNPIEGYEQTAQLRFISPITWTTYGAGLFNVALSLEVMP